MRGGGGGGAGEATVATAWGLPTQEQQFPLLGTPGALTLLWDAGPHALGLGHGSVNENVGTTFVTMPKGIPGLMPLPKPAPSALPSHSCQVNGS